MVAVAIARPGPVGTNRRLLCPFDLQVWAVDRMLNFEIIDDPIYEGLELQVSDDPAHGTGMIVLLKRRQDGRFDIYRQPGLTLDPELAQVGGQSSSGQSRCRCSSWAAATWSAVAAGSSRSASTTTRSRPGACLGPGCTAAGWTSTPPPTPPWWWSTGPTTDPAARRHTGPWRGRGSPGSPRDREPARWQRRARSQPRARTGRPRSDESGIRGEGEGGLAAGRRRRPDRCRGYLDRQAIR